LPSRDFSAGLIALKRARPPRFPELRNLARRVHHHVTNCTQDGGLSCELTARSSGKTVAERESVIFVSGKSYLGFPIRREIFDVNVSGLAVGT
jgi:hypothetical protein